MELFLLQESLSSFKEYEILDIEQITKADRDACHALCGTGKARAMLRRLSSTVSQLIEKRDYHV